MTPAVAVPATQIPQTPPRVAARTVDAEQRAALDLLSTFAARTGSGRRTAPGGPCATLWPTCSANTRSWRLLD
jgi:hypothetical protein